MPTSFEEIYCIAFQVLDKTWDEMKASYMDFSKVIAAVRSHVEAVLDSQPINIEVMNRALLMSPNSGIGGTVITSQSSSNISTMNSSNSSSSSTGFTGITSTGTSNNTMSSGTGTGSRDGKLK